MAGRRVVQRRLTWRLAGRLFGNVNSVVNQTVGFQVMLSGARGPMYEMVYRRTRITGRVSLIV